MLPQTVLKKVRAMVKTAFFRELARMGEESLVLEGLGYMNLSLAHCVRTNL